MAKTPKEFSTVKVPRGMIWRLKAYAAKRKLTLQEAVSSILEKELKASGD
jgi:hypothetical protein